MPAIGQSLRPCLCASDFVSLRVCVCVRGGSTVWSQLQLLQQQQWQPQQPGAADLLLAAGGVVACFPLLQPGAPSPPPPLLPCPSLLSPSLCVCGRRVVCPGVTAAAGCRARLGDGNGYAADSRSRALTPHAPERETERDREGDRDRETE